MLSLFISIFLTASAGDLQQTAPQSVDFKKCALNLADMKLAAQSEGLVVFKTDSASHFWFLTSTIPDEVTIEPVTGFESRVASNVEPVIYVDKIGGPGRIAAILFADASGAERERTFEVRFKNPTTKPAAFMLNGGTTLNSFLITTRDPDAPSPFEECP